MLDLTFVRANLGLVEEKLRARGTDPAVLLGGFAELDARRRAAVTRVETLKAERNKLSDEVGKRKRAGEDVSALTNRMPELKDQIERQENESAAAEMELRGVLQSIPNLPHDSVPPGKSEHDNVEVRSWGTKPEFAFTPKPHWELGESLGVLDFERAAKLSGARFAVYWDQGARLERALANFMLNVHTGEQQVTLWHRAVAEVCRRPISMSGRRRTRIQSRGVSR